MKTHSKIAALLKQAMGLDVATVGRTALEHAVRSRIAASGVGDAERYWERLANSDAELQELIEAMVIPETWFFRDTEAFTALVTIVVNEWLPGHRGQPLRVLSVPCASGEEPYSIAMALLDAGLSPHQFKVDAVDISARSLALARRAVYAKNSFRSAELSFRDRYFRERQGRYELATTVRERVHFQAGNLLAPGCVVGADPYDFVFCRNVLIYFDGPTQQQVISKLGKLLAAEGILFVGPAEAFLVRGNRFVSTPHPRAFAYRKATTASVPRTFSASEPPRRKIKPERKGTKPPSKAAAKPSLNIQHSARGAG